MKYSTALSLRDTFDDEMRRGGTPGFIGVGLGPVQTEAGVDLGLVVYFDEQVASKDAFPASFGGLPVVTHPGPTDVDAGCFS